MNNKTVPWPQVCGKEWLDWWDHAPHEDRIRYLRDAAPNAYPWMTPDMNFNHGTALISRIAGHQVAVAEPTMGETFERLYREHVMGEK